MKFITLIPFGFWIWLALLWLILYVFGVNALIAFVLISAVLYVF